MHRASSEGSALRSEALLTWHRGEATWAETTARYEAEATAKMRPMFEATMQRVKRETYSMPPFIARTVLKWLVCDPEYQRRFGERVVRKLLGRYSDSHPKSL